MMQQPLICLSGVAILLICLVTDALQLPTTRRDAVISAVAGVFGAPTIALAQTSSTAPIATLRSDNIRQTIIPSVDPSPLMSIRGGKNGKTTTQIPRVGYSLYKTAPEQVSRCTALSLRAGIRHFDVASLYGSNTEIAVPLKMYLDNGIKQGLAKYYKEEKDELLELLDATSQAGEKHALETIGFRMSVSPSIDGSAGRRQRREGLFISHKISNKI